MTVSMIHIRFLKNDSDFDDQFRVTRSPDAEDHFDVSYTYAKTRRTLCRRSLTADRVTTWIRQMILLVLADDEPFDQVQLEVPMMPVTLFNVEELMENYRILTEAVQFSLENWPEEDEMSTIAHSTEDEDEDEDDEEGHPSPPMGGCPMDEEGIQERGRHHQFFDDNEEEDATSSETESE